MAGEGPAGPLDAIVGFVEALRRAGIEIPVGSTVTFAKALTHLDPTRRGTLYWAGRTTLLDRPEDVARYDAVFSAFWEHGQGVVTAPVAVPPATTLVVDDADGVDHQGEPDPSQDGDQLVVRYSPAEVLRHQDFAECTDDELAETHRLMASMRVGAPTRPARRHVRSGRRGARPDLRRTVRQSMRTGGEAIERRHTDPTDRPRRLVLLADVSGSMEPYARSLLRFVHAAASGRGRVEVFTLGTRLTRLTRELATRDPDAALERATAAVEDWAGGTRLGALVGEFNDRWGIRGMARGAVVVILSDGWDRGDPEELAEAMQRLHRVAHRVIWVNPLKATPGYQPLARGMAAALPHIDRFVEGHSLAALESLAKEIAA